MEQHRSKVARNFHLQQQKTQNTYSSNYVTFVTEKKKIEPYKGAVSTQIFRRGKCLCAITEANDVRRNIYLFILAKGPLNVTIVSMLAGPR